MFVKWCEMTRSFIDFRQSIKQFWYKTTKNNTKFVTKSYVFLSSQYKQWKSNNLPGIPYSHSIRFKLPSGFFIGRAMKPKGWSFLQAFLSSDKRAWAIPLMSNSDSSELWLFSLGQNLPKLNFEFSFDLLFYFFISFLNSK